MSGAVRSTVQVWLAGVASVLPAASVARTSKVWLPAPSEPSVSGLEHDVQLPPSMRHSKVEPASEELNEKVGVVSFDGSGGVESIVVAGGVRSTIHVYEAGVASVSAGGIRRANLERVAAFGERRGERVRAGARRPGSAVDAAFEGRAGLGGAEREVGSRVVGRIAGSRVEGRVRRSQVDRPRVARRAGVGVAGRIDRADVERVAALGQCG